MLNVPSIFLFKFFGNNFFLRLIYVKVTVHIVPLFNKLKKRKRAQHMNVHLRIVTQD